jgi:hypothetical protein
MAKKKTAKAKRKRPWPYFYTRGHRCGQASDVVDFRLIWLIHQVDNAEE